MVDIKINNQLVDMFSDTKVSGNYTPIDITGGENGFSVPFTNKFSIPMTERNIEILGYDKKTMSFTKDVLEGEVIVDGVSLFYGVVEINGITYENLEEVAEISIVDIVSHVLNKGKEKTLGEIFDYEPYKNHRYFMLGSTAFPNNQLYNLSYIDETGFGKLDETEEGSTYAYLRRNKEEFGLPISFSALEMMKACLGTYNVEFVPDNLPYDFVNNDVRVYFGMDYVSAKSKPTEGVDIKGMMCGTTVSTKYSSDQQEQVFKDYAWSNKLATYGTIINGLDYIFTSSESNTGFPSESFSSQGMSFQMPQKQYRVKSNLNTKIMLKPKYGRFTNRLADIGTGASNYIGFIGRRHALPAGQAWSKLYLRAKGVELWTYLVGADDSIKTRYKCADVELSTDINGDCYVESINVTDDYLYADMLNIETGENFKILNVLHFPQDSKLENGIDNTQTFDCLGSDIIGGEGENMFYIGILGWFDMYYEVMYDNADTKILQENCLDTFNKNDVNTYADGSYPTVWSGELSNYLSQLGRIVDLRESFVKYGLTVYDFLTDLLKRFNVKMSSNGKNIYLSPMTGGSLLGESDDSFTIDISTKVNSEITASKADSESKIRTFQIKNASRNLCQDRFFNGDTFGDSPIINSDKTKTDDKVVELKSSLSTEVVAGKRITNLSDDVLNLIHHVGSNKLIGSANYEAPKTSEVGIRYGYINGSKKVIPMLPVSLSMGDDGKEWTETLYQNCSKTASSTVNLVSYAKGKDNVNSGVLNIYAYYNGLKVCGSVRYLNYYGVVIYYDWQVWSHQNSYFFCVDPIFPDTGVQPFTDMDYITHRIWTFDRSKQCLVAPASNVAEFCLRDYYPNPSTYPMSSKQEISKASLFEMAGSNYALIQPYSTMNGYSKGYQAPVYDTNFLINGGFAKDGSVEIPSIKCYVEKEDRLDTLSFGVVGLKSAKPIVTAYERYFKQYEDSIITPKGVVLELEVYLNRDECQLLLRGADIKLYGEKFILVEATDLDFTNAHGGIVKLKIAKLKYDKKP